MTSRMRKHGGIVVLFLIMLLTVTLTACQGAADSPLPHLSKSFFGKAAEGDAFLLGTYEQDNNFDNGPENIEWVVLEKGSEYIIAISKYAIECMPFHESENWEDTCWETCTLRSWLNQDFYNSSFTDEERQFISTTRLDNLGNQHFGLDNGNATEDFVVLLDRDTIEYVYEDIEIGIYRISNEKEGYDVEMTASRLGDYEPLAAQFTEYAKLKYIETMPSYLDYEKDIEAENGKNSCSWWTCSRGDQANASLVVANGGFVMSCPAAASLGIRPVITISTTTK